MEDPAEPSQTRIASVFPAANDDHFEPPPIPPGAGATEMCECMLGAPEDLSCLPASAIGLNEALKQVAARIPEACEVRDRVASGLNASALRDSPAASAEAAALFSRRRGRQGYYLSLVALGISKSNEPSCDRSLVDPVAFMIGTWAIRRKLCGWSPKQTQVSRAIEVLTKPNSGTSKGWPLAARERSAADAAFHLRKAIESHPAAAAELGLAPKVEVRTTENDPILIFNRCFRRRMANLFEHKTVDDQAGGGGNGSLSSAAMKRIGREIRAGMRAGDPAYLHLGLEIVSHLTTAIVQKLPVQLGKTPPARALAWLDLPAGEYCYVLYLITERGRRPDAGTDALYERTEQVVRIRLSPPLAEGLQALAPDIEGEFTTGRELLGEVSREARAAVAGTGPYKATVAKIQASIPSLLLQDHELRWAAALATSSPFLVSKGRPAYAAIYSTWIDRAAQAACRVLDWPVCASPHTARLVGAFTTPKVLAVLTALSTLAAEADSYTLPVTSVAGVVASINAHAAYLALLLAFSYALRDRVVYPLPTCSLRAGLPAKFSDKDIHDHSMPAVPTLQIVCEAMAGWTRLIQAAVDSLDAINTPEAQALAKKLRVRLADHVGDGWVFTVNSAGDLEPMGTSTWRRRLPKAMRLVVNFGRQFWPLHLTELGVAQRDLDILMRHQMPMLHPGSTHVERTEHETQQSLLQAMTWVVEERMRLKLPKALTQGSSGCHQVQ